MRAKTVTVKIRYRDFKTHTRALTMPEASDDPARIREVAVSLLDRFTLDRPVRLVGVRVSGFTPGPEDAGGAAPGPEGTAADGGGESQAADGRAAPGGNTEMGRLPL
jgi:hypothetical protein